MRWLMKRESSVRRTAPSLHDDKSNATVLREFVEPETSPVYETLENGAALFDADAWNYEEWRLYKAFTPLDDVSAWTQVWSQLLPVLARIDSRLLLDLLRWPLRAVSALGPDSPFRQKVVEGFRIARTCCVSPDLEELRASVTSLLDDKCIQVIQAFAENYDLTNYDNELNHSQMRTVLAAQGADLSFGNVSTFKMGFDLGNHHKHAVTEPQAPRPRRGRPIKVKKQIKRKRLDAWNVFVSTHKPTCPRSQAGQCIKEGEHLRRLGRQWKELSAEMRRPYERMSVARQAAQSAHESSAEEDHAEQDPAPVRGPLTWPFCDESSPLRGPLLCKPEFTDDIGTKVDEWVQNIEAIVCHDPMALPTHATTYACHCTPGLCRQSKFDEATRMKNIFFRRKNIRVLSAYAVVGEGSGDESIFSSCFLVAHAFNKPKKLVFLLLEPVLPTLWADVHTAQNFPWSFKFARVASDAGRQRLHFIIDMHFFVDVATKAARLAVDQVECQELKFQVSGLDSLLVESAVMPLGLMNPIFDELHELDSTGTSRLGNYVMCNRVRCLTF